MKVTFGAVSFKSSAPQYLQSLYHRSQTTSLHQTLFPPKWSLFNRTEKKSLSTFSWSSLMLVVIVIIVKNNLISKAESNQNV